MRELSTDWLNQQVAPTAISQDDFPDGQEPDEGTPPAA
jgi:hypothetical protein